MSDYFLIRNNDGDTHVENINIIDFLDDLNNGYYDNVEFLDSIDETDTNYWGRKQLIIKGKIVVPRPAETVVKYEIE